jgi:hypothetical protein
LAATQPNRREEGSGRVMFPGVTPTLAKARSVHPRLSTSTAARFPIASVERTVLSRTLSKARTPTAYARAKGNWQLFLTRIITFQLVF